jgi:hypothetical protein
MISNHPRNSAVLRRQVLRLFGVPVLIAIGVYCLMVLVQHVRLGADSPGIVGLGRLDLLWLPVLFLFVVILPSARSLIVIRRMVPRARGYGLTWYEYMDLSTEERSRLRPAADDEQT